SRLGYLWAICRIGVVPSGWEEPFGRTVVEGFRSGHGVVVSNRGGLPELVRPGVTGWVWDSQTGDLREVLVEALASDPRRVGAEARSDWRLRFTREVVARQYLDVYDDLLEVGSTIP